MEALLIVPLRNGKSDSRVPTKSTPRQRLKKYFRSQLR